MAEKKNIKAKKTNRNTRADHQKNKRREYDKQRKRLLRAGKANGANCAICGLPIDFELKHPHPMSVSVDHIIPLSKGGSVADPDNLQLTHFQCNVKKSDQVFIADTIQSIVHKNEKIGNRVLPQSCDWLNY